MENEMWNRNKDARRVLVCYFSLTPVGNETGNRSSSNKGWSHWSIHSQTGSTTLEIELTFHKVLFCLKNKKIKSVVSLCLVEQIIWVLFTVKITPYQPLLSRKLKLLTALCMSAIFFSYYRKVVWILLKTADYLYSFWGGVTSFTATVFM